MIQVRQSANIIEVAPSCEDLLGGLLTYTHVQTLHGRHAKDRPANLIRRRVYGIEGGKLYTLAGLRSKVLTALKASGRPHRFEDLRPPFPHRPDFDNLLRNIPDLSFRVGQEDALKAMIRWDRGVIVAPTGWGKSFLVRCLSLLYPQAKILVVVPRRDLMEKMYEEFRAFTPRVGRVGGGKAEMDQRLLVSTDKSVLKASLANPEILLFDEVHKAAASKTSEDLAQLRTPYKWFGFSATPYGRTDGADLVIEALFGPAVCHVSYQDAVADGAVVPLNVEMQSLAVGVPERNTCGDAKSGVTKRRRCYWKNGARNRALLSGVEKAKKKYGTPPDAQTLVLVQTLEHAAHISRLLPDVPIIYGSQDSRRVAELVESDLLPPDFQPLSDSRRNELRRAFERGDLRTAIATGVWDTGVDFRALQIVVYASGEVGEIPVVQAFGRASRTHESKDRGIIIDCEDQFDKWARNRALQRMREYRKKGWVIHLPGRGTYRNADHQLALL